MHQLVSLHLAITEVGEAGLDLKENDDSHALLLLLLLLRLLLFVQRKPQTTTVVTLPGSSDPEMYDCCTNGYKVKATQLHALIFWQLELCRANLTGLARTLSPTRWRKPRRRRLGWTPRSTTTAPRRRRSTKPAAASRPRCGPTRRVKEIDTRGTPASPGISCL